VVRSIVWNRDKDGIIRLSRRKDARPSRVSEATLTAYEIEAALVIRHQLDLAGQQVHSRGRLVLVRVADIEVALRLHGASPLLPHSPHLALTFLQQVTGARDAVLLVSLELVQRVSCIRVRVQL